MTGRPEVAAQFIGRFTIESAVAGVAWLPEGDQLPTDPTVRPWSGVVWSGKVDPNTFFDPAPESALGIRLLPLGPPGLARYPDVEAVDAAEFRWAWCDEVGGGCTTRWANLLDSDAVVAGWLLLSGPDPEPSTAAAMSAWWRTLWERTGIAGGWSCSTGAVARRATDDSVIVLASNPGPKAVELSCTDPDGRSAGPTRSGNRWRSACPRRWVRPLPPWEGPGRP